MMLFLFLPFERPVENQKMTALQMGSSQPDLLLDVLLVKSERLLEHTPEFPDLSLETFLVGPSLPRVQQLRWNALQRSGDGEVEGVESLVLGLGEFTGMDAIDDATSVLEWASGTGSILATGPASVDKPAVDLVLGHTLGQHLGIPSRLLKNIRSLELSDTEYGRPDNLREGR